MELFDLPFLFRNAIADGNCVESKEGLIFCAKKEWIEPLKEKYALKSVKLDDVLIPRKVFNASVLFVTAVGKHGDNGIIQPKELDKHGTLSFGPYVDLPKGRYRIEIEYASPSDPDVVVGKWDIATERGGRIISEGLLMGTGDVFTSMTYELELDEYTRDIEVRTFYEGIEGLALRSVVITRLDD